MLGKDKTLTIVTQETRTRATTENADGTTTTTMTRSVTSNTVTKDNETGETTVQYGKTQTSTYSETTNSEGKVVGSTTPTTTESKTTSQDDKSMKNLNAWTSKISTFNASHDKTFNQTIASQGRMAMSAAALAPAVLLPISGTTVLMDAGGRLLVVVPSGPAGVGVVIGTAPGAVIGITADIKHSGCIYLHSTSQTKIKDGAAIPLIRHNVLDR